MRQFFLPHCAAMLAILLAGAVHADDELATRLAHLEAEVARLELEQDDAAAWRTEARTAEIRQLTESVLRDADLRLASTDDALLAGYDDGFYIRDASGNLTLELSGQLQFRYGSNHQTNSPRDDHVSGFENRRTKIRFQGEIHGLSFLMTVAFDDDNGQAEIQGPYMQWRLTDRMQMRVGRFRSPLLREEMISSKRQLTVERSLIARRFDQNRLQGVGLIYRDDDWLLRAGVMSTDGYAGPIEGYIVSGRAERRLYGDWGELRDYTSFPEDTPTASLGFGALYQWRDGPDALGATDETLIRWTADLAVEWGGRSLFAAVVGNHRDEDGLASLDQYGAVVQGGMFVTTSVEAFARYEWGEADSRGPHLSVLTTGINWYHRRHDLKWTFDVGYGFNEVSGFWASGGAGWRRDRAGEEGQVVLRGQLQLLF